MKKSGIERSVLVSIPWVSRDLCSENNTYILTVAKNHECFRAICSIQPRCRGWQDEADQCLSEGAVGLKVNPAWQGFDLDGDEMDGLAEYVRGKNRVLMVHVDHPYKKSRASAYQLLNFVGKHPHTRILATHMGGLLGLYSNLTGISDLVKNLWFDTAVSSTLQFVRFYVETGMKEKLVFGTDFPFNHSHSQEQVVRDLQSLNLGSATEQAVFHDNGQTLFAEA
ncbi:MAG: hypothetical protein CSYNP_04287 [Syntrophus sp. SKADARSKE-3]|nr:hypothetical protein [Syntrophus sp. SKADARSKE-3]